MFVVVEGLDGAGTTTQTHEVAEALRRQGVEVVTTREPSDGPVGRMIREMIGMRETLPGGRAVGRSTLALLFAADRLYHVEAEIEPELEAGKVVISDRYVASSLAYQGDVEGGDVDYGWVREVNRRARRPDLTVFLRAEAQLCLDRLSGREERDLFETREKLERLVARYDEVMAMLSEEGEAVLELDARRSVGELTEAIVGALRERMGQG